MPKTLTVDQDGFHFSFDMLDDLPIEKKAQIAMAILPGHLLSELISAIILQGEEKREVFERYGIDMWWGSGVVNETMARLDPLLEPAIRKQIEDIRAENKKLMDIQRGWDTTLYYLGNLSERSNSRQFCDFINQFRKMAQKNCGWNDDQFRGFVARVCRGLEATQEERV